MHERRTHARRAENFATCERDMGGKTCARFVVLGSRIRYAGLCVGNRKDVFTVLHRSGDEVPSSKWREFWHVMSSATPLGEVSDDERSCWYLQNAVDIAEARFQLFEVIPCSTSKMLSDCFQFSNHLSQRFMP
jgi:hypothetical protein